MPALFRGAREEDVKDLFLMLVESTSGLTKLTEDELRNDLFGLNSQTSVEVSAEDLELQFDIDQLQTNKPVAQAIVAEVEGAIVGYLIFHYHYTPWKGSIAFIDDIFTRPDMRKKGIGRALIRKTIEIAKNDGLKNFLFTVGRMSSELRHYIETNGNSYWYRNDNTDWSVLRIDFARGEAIVRDARQPCH